MWNDCFGREIKVGDIVYYQLNRGYDQARWGEVLELYNEHPHNIVTYIKKCPCIRVKSVQNTKDVILSLHQYNAILNLSAPPITDLKQIPVK